MIALLVSLLVAVILIPVLQAWPMVGLVLCALAVLSVLEAAS